MLDNNKYKNNVIYPEFNQILYKMLTTHIHF